MIAIELFGVVRLRAGLASISVDAAMLGDALKALRAECPALEGIVLGGHVHPAYRVNLNGDRFVSDPETPLIDGDSLLVLAADVGG